MAWVRRAIHEATAWIDGLTSYIPGHTGVVVRAALLGRRFGAAGSRLRIGTGVDIGGHSNIFVGTNVSIMRNSGLYAMNGRISIGDNFSMNANSCLGAADGGDITIGNNVLIAQNVVLRAADHSFEDVDAPISRQGHAGGFIHIEDDCWIGANVVITRNVRIGAHSIVAAGAVVTHDVEPRALVGGVPARLIRKRA